MTTPVDVTQLSKPNLYLNVCDAYKGIGVWCGAWNPHPSVLFNDHDSYWFFTFESEEALSFYQDENKRARIIWRSPKDAALERKEERCLPT